MKYSHFIFTILLCNLFTFPLFSQKEKPVSWNFETKKVSDKEIEFIAIATMQNDWVIYSQFTDDDGPVPTIFVVNDSDTKLEEKSKIFTEFDELFGVNVSKFKNKAVFTKRFKIEELPVLKGYVTYMTCDGAKCLPPTDVVFELNW